MTRRPLRVAVVRSDYHFSGIKRYLEAFSGFIARYRSDIELHMLVHPEYLANWPRYLRHRRLRFPCWSRWFARMQWLLPTESNLLGIRGAARMTRRLNALLSSRLGLTTDAWPSRADRYLRCARPAFDVVYYCQPNLDQKIVDESIPSVCLWTDFSEDLGAAYGERLRKACEYWFCRSSAVVFLTETMERRAFELVPDFPRERSHVIRVPPWLAPPTRRAAAAMRRRLPDAGTPIYAVVPGRGDPRKMQHLVIEALGELRRGTGCSLVPVFCGPGTDAFCRKPSHAASSGGMGYAEKVYRTAERFSLAWGQDVVSLGLLDEGELGALYHTVQVCIFPSRYEGLGLPLLEAISCGLPVVCSDIPVFREEIGARGLRVWFFEQGSAVSLACTLSELLGQWDAALAVAASNRVRVHETRAEHFASDYAALFVSVAPQGEKKDQA